MQISAPLLINHEKVKEKVSQLHPTLPLMECPGKNIVAGSGSLLLGNLPNTGIKPRSPTLQADFDQLSHLGSPRKASHAHTKHLIGDI